MTVLSPARAKDSALFYRLRNLPEVRAASGHTGEIDPDEHYLWWYTGAKEHRFVIRPDRGYVRVAPDGMVSIAIDPGYRGQGLATQALEEIPRVVNIRPLTAVIQYDNLGSQRAFSKAGWRPTQFTLR